MTTTVLSQYHSGGTCKNLTSCVTLISFFLATLLPGMVTSMPASDVGQALKGWGHEEPEKFQYFLTEQGSVALNIYPDGTINGSNCKTKYSAFRITPHYIQSSGTEKEERRGSVLQAVAADRLLCLNLTSHKLYASKEFNEKSCTFVLKHKYVQKKPDTPNTSPIVYVLDSVTHHHTKYYVSLDCSGKPRVLRSCMQRRRYGKYKVFNVGEMFLDSADTCEPRNICRDPLKHLHFCQRVQREFFTATYSDFQKYRKRKCYKKIKRAEEFKSRCRSANRSRRRRYAHSPVSPT